MKSVRWTPEQLQEFIAKRKTHTGPQPARLERERATRFRGVDIDSVHRSRPSKIERRFEQQLTDAGITGYQRDYFFMPKRDFELDFAWAPVKVAVEVQGMAHRIKGKFKRDIEKRALALLAGWRVLEVGGDEVRSGKALEWLRMLLR